jgi:hypothetical protein
LNTIPLRLKGFPKSFVEVYVPARLLSKRKTVELPDVGTLPPCGARRRR